MVIKRLKIFSFALFLILLPLVPAYSHDVAIDFINLPDWTGAAQPPQATDAEIARLFQLCKDSDRVVRVIAVRALGETGRIKPDDGPGNPILSTLLTLTKDDDVLVRVAAIQSLGLLKNPTAVGPITDILKASTSDTLDSICVHALISIGTCSSDSYASLVESFRNGSSSRKETIIDELDEEKETIVPNKLIDLAPDQFVSAVNDTSIQTKFRICLMEMLIKSSNPAVHNSLVATLDPNYDPDGYVRIIAWKSLAKTNEDSVLQKLIALASDTSPKVRADAISAIGESSSPTAMAILKQSLSDVDSKVRVSVAYALAASHSPDAAPILIKMLDDKDPKVKAAGISCLGNLKVKAVVPTLTAILGTADTKSALANPCIGTSIYALGRIGDARSIKSLVSVEKYAPIVLHDPVCRALAGIKDPTAVKAMITMLDTRIFTGVGPTPNEAVDQLSAMGTSVVLPLISALKDPNPRVREGAALVFCKTKDKRSVTPLITALNDNELAVRAAAALALGNQGESRAVASLANQLKINDEAVNDCVSIALGELGSDKAGQQVVKSMQTHMGYFKSKTRMPAVEACAKLNNTDATGPILTTFKYWVMLHASLDTREATVSALRTLTGQDFGHAYHRWLAWGVAENKWRPRHTNDEHVHP